MPRQIRRKLIGDGAVTSSSDLMQKTTAHPLPFKLKAKAAIGRHLEAMPGSTLTDKSSQTLR